MKKLVLLLMVAGLVMWIGVANATSVYLYVDAAPNVYGSPDVGFVSGSTESFKGLNLYDTATATRGTENNGTGTATNQIGRAKSRGFEYATGTPSSFTFSSTFFL